MLWVAGVLRVTGFFFLPLGLPAGLDSEPELLDLTNWVAAKIPARWREVGLQLNIKPGELDAIRGHNFEEVFTLWKTQRRCDYTWRKLLQALEAPAITEMKLAYEIRIKLAE